MISHPPRPADLIATHIHGRKESERGDGGEGERRRERERLVARVTLSVRHIRRGSIKCMPESVQPSAKHPSKALAVQAETRGRNFSSNESESEGAEGRVGGRTGGRSGGWAIERSGGWSVQRSSDRALGRSGKRLGRAVGRSAIRAGGLTSRHLH